MGLVEMYIKFQELFKCFSNKNVFNLDLKRLNLYSSLIALGNLFQSDGAAAINVLSPIVFFVFMDSGTIKTWEFEQDHTGTGIFNMNKVTNIVRCLAMYGLKSNH